MVLEAAKMQNHIYSPTTAKISEKVKEGQSVKMERFLLHFNKFNYRSGDVKVLVVISIFLGLLLISHFQMYSVYMF